jgi:hypothetical protein
MNSSARSILLDRLAGGLLLLELQNRLENGRVVVVAIQHSTLSHLARCLPACRKETRSENPHHG